MKIKFAKLNDKAVIPSKRNEDAGFDIYTYSDEIIIIEPSETVILHTGIASVIDDGYFVELKERGSTGTKGIGQRSGVIDSGYRGEWMIPITNHNSIPVVLYNDDNDLSIFDGLDFIKYPLSKAICQAIVLPVPTCEIEEINKEQLELYKSERGDGKLGSSGK